MSGCWWLRLRARVATAGVVRVSVRSSGACEARAGQADLAQLSHQARVAQHLAAHRLALCIQVPVEPRVLSESSQLTIESGRLSESLGAHLPATSLGPAVGLLRWTRSMSSSLIPNEATVAVVPVSGLPEKKSVCSEVGIPLCAQGVAQDSQPESR